MKKTLLLLSLITIFASTSCTSDNSLNDTVWVMTYSEKGNSSVMTYSFQEKTCNAVLVIVTGDETEKMETNGTYTYDHPIVTMILNEGKETEVGTIKDNVMELMGMDFIKQ